MAKYLRIPRATLQRIIAKLEDKGTVKTLKVGKQIGSITICNYARYQGLGKSTRASKNATTKERTEEEKKSLPPHPLIEEKKEKRKKDPAVAVNFSNVKLTHTIGGASLSSKMPAAAPTFNDRRQAFWNECQRYATRYSEEMLRNFFLYWTETNSRKPDKMRFEKEKTFQVGLRLQKWKHNGDVFGEDRVAQRRKQPATTQYTTLNAKETATMESLIDHQQQREAQWKERSRKAVKSFFHEKGHKSQQIATNRNIAPLPKAYLCIVKETPR